MQKFFTFRDFMSIKIINLLGLLSLFSKEREIKFLELFDTFDFLKNDYGNEEVYGKIVMYFDESLTSRVAEFECSKGLTIQEMQNIFLDYLFPDGIPTSVRVLIDLR